MSGDPCWSGFCRLGAVGRRRGGVVMEHRQGQQTLTKLTTIQAGRALAALAVAAFHLSMMMGLAQYGGVPVLRDWTRRGNLGVDFFFVLSGFVILMAHHDDIGRPARFGQYLWKRFIRVYPIYWLYTALSVTLVLVGLGNSALTPKTAAGWASTLTLIRFSPESPRISPAWTLFHEVAFYLLFATLIANRRIGLIIMALWVTACGALWHYPPEDGPTAAAVYLSAYSAHFVLGMLAFLAYRHLRWQGCICLGVAGLAVTRAAYYTSHLASPCEWACGFSGLLLICASAERQYGIRAPGLLRYIGDASYSLYLLHLALLGVLLKVAIQARLLQSIGGVGVYLLVLAGATLLACATYRWVEAPMLRSLRSFAHRRSC